MAYLHPTVADEGLAYLRAQVTTLHLCSAEPATYAEVLTYSLGNKAVSLSAIGDYAGSVGTGRKVTCPAISDGTSTDDGSPVAWALISGSNVLAVGDGLFADTVTGVDFELSAFDIVLLDP